MYVKLLSLNNIVIFDNIYKNNSVINAPIPIKYGKVPPDIYNCLITCARKLMRELCCGLRSLSL